MVAFSSQIIHKKENFLSVVTENDTTNPVFTFCVTLWYMERSPESQKESKRKGIIQIEKIREERYSSRTNQKKAQRLIIPTFILSLKYQTLFSRSR